MFVGGDITPEQPKNVFTLSEVILTVGIIGIIAALTIPQLVQNSNNKEIVAGFLKTHSVLLNAFKEAEAVEDTKVYKLSSLDEFKTFFEKHLKTQANCDYDVCLADGSKFDKLFVLIIKYINNKILISFCRFWFLSQQSYS